MVRDPPMSRPRKTLDGTSFGTFLPKRYGSDVFDVEGSVAASSNLPCENQEQVRVLRCENGQESMRTIPTV